MDSGNWQIIFNGSYAINNNGIIISLKSRNGKRLINPINGYVVLYIGHKIKKRFNLLDLINYYIRN